MNKHPKEVVDFMKSTSHIGRPRKSKDLASYEDKYGEERIIHLTRSGLRVKNKNTTVVFQLNQRVAELTSQKIKARRIALGLTLEDVCIKTLFIYLGLNFSALFLFEVRLKKLLKEK